MTTGRDVVVSWVIVCWFKVVKDVYGRVVFISKCCFWFIFT